MEGSNSKREVPQNHILPCILTGSLYGFFGFLLNVMHQSERQSPLARLHCWLSAKRNPLGLLV